MNQNNEKLKKVIKEIAIKKEELRKLETIKKDLEDPKIETLGLDVRIINALNRKDITKISELMMYIEKDPQFIMLRGIGEKSSNEIYKKLNN